MQNSINPLVRQFLKEYNAQSDIDQYKKGVGKKVDSIIYIRNYISKFFLALYFVYIY